MGAVLSEAPPAARADGALRGASGGVVERLLARVLEGAVRQGVHEALGRGYDVRRAHAHDVAPRGLQLREVDAQRGRAAQAVHGNRARGRAPFVEGARKLPGAASGAADLDELNRRAAVLPALAAGEGVGGAVLGELDRERRAVRVRPPYRVYRGALPQLRADRPRRASSLGPPAEPLSGEAVQRHGVELALGEVDVEANAHCRVGRVNVLHEVGERGASRRHALDAPLEPRELSRAALPERARPDVAEHGPRARGARRGARVNELPVPCRRCRERRHDRLNLLVGQLLRLVEHDHGVGCAAPAAARAARELDARARGEVDALLAVGVSDGLDQSRHLDVARVLEHARKALERLLHGLDEVGGVQDRLAAHDQLVELVGLEDRVLSVLARDGQPHREVGRRAVLVDRQEGAEHDLLPRVQRESVLRYQQRSVVPVAPGGLSRLYPCSRLLRPCPRTFPA